MLETLADYKSCGRFVIVGGDWNLTEHPSDSANNKLINMDLPTKRAFEALLEAHNLEEVYQPTHTRIVIS